MFPSAVTEACGRMKMKARQELTKQYYATKERAMQELIKLGERIEQTGNGENTAFVFAHQEILSDPTMDKEIVELIGDEAYCPDSAIIKIYEKYIKIFSKSKNKVIQERASDLRDVQTRLLRCWHHMPEKNLSSLDRPCIVVAEELFPSDTLGLDQKNILGIITQNGGTTSHTAIIARSMEIPALLGVSGIVDAVHDGEFVILDGVRGRALLDPDAETQQEYTAHIAKAERELAITRRYFQKTAETLDGTCMELRVNIASDDCTDWTECRILTVLDCSGASSSICLRIRFPQRNPSLKRIKPLPRHLRASPLCYVRWTSAATSRSHIWTFHTKKTRSSETAACAYA